MPNTWLRFHWNPYAFPGPSALGWITPLSIISAEYGPVLHRINWSGDGDALPNSLSCMVPAFFKQGYIPHPQSTESRASISTWEPTFTFWHVNNRPLFSENWAATTTSLVSAHIIFENQLLKYGYRYLIWARIFKPRCVGTYSMWWLAWSFVTRVSWVSLALCCSFVTCPIGCLFHECH